MNTYCDDCKRCTGGNMRNSDVPGGDDHNRCWECEATLQAGMAVAGSMIAALEAERDALRKRCEELESVNTKLAKQLKAQDFALEHILDALDIDPEETHIDIKSGDSVVASVSIAELHSRAQAALAATEVKP